MTRTSLPHSPEAVPSLGGLLRRAHVSLALGAVAVVGLVLAIPAIITLHVYAAHDLRLVGRAIAQTVEAAAVFDDVEAAQEALDSILENEDISEATITSRNGRILATWHANRSGLGASLQAAAARLSFLEPASIPVLHERAAVGRVEVRSGGRSLLRFVALGVLGIVACQFLIAAGALYLSRRLVGRLVAPLHALAEITGTVQRERAFQRRVPSAGIAELNDLGASFNALLAQLDTWQAFMEGENRRLSHQATHDSLTGLPNRAFFEGRLERALSDARQSGAAVAVMLADCNRFKDVNDTFGHAAGDTVLVAVAARLRGHFRDRDLVARLGGDEFAVLIAPGQPDLTAMCTTLSMPMQVPLALSNQVVVSTSLSVGLAVFPADGATAAYLLQKADEAMYRAKRARAEPAENKRDGTRG